MPILRRHVLVPVLALASAVAAPATAGAQSPTGGTEAAPEPEVASASAGPVSVRTSAGALLHRTARVRGTIATGGAGRTVTVERLDELTRTWTLVAHATTRRHGRFVARWTADRPGPARLRTRVEAVDAATASAAPLLEVTVYRTARATWYGPGFYGRRTACGVRLRRTTLGVAHMALECGTRVTVFYQGRSITVPVIDRGPFRRRTTWDLTAATARAIGFTATDEVGTLQALSR